jgi:ABC-type glutathione transport system ATPase component
MVPSGYYYLVAMTTSNGQTEYVVRVRDVVKEYQMGKLTVRALDGVTLDISTGASTSRLWDPLAPAKARCLI